MPCALARCCAALSTGVLLGRHVRGFIAPFTCFIRPCGRLEASSERAAERRRRLLVLRRVVLERARCALRSVLSQGSLGWSSFLEGGTLLAGWAHSVERVLSEASWVVSLPLPLPLADPVELVARVGSIEPLRIRCQSSPPITPGPWEDRLPVSIRLFLMSRVAQRRSGSYLATPRRL